MTPCSIVFTVNGEPQFGDPTTARPDFGKKLEALASKQGLRFGMAALYPPSEFPGYPHRHFEYCLFTGKTASSDFTPIDFDYYKHRHNLIVRSELPVEQVRPIVKFIAKHYLRVTIEQVSNSWIRGLVVIGKAPPSRQFYYDCQELARFIWKSSKIVDLNIQRQPLVRSYLDQMAKCMQEFNHDDVEQMVEGAYRLHKSLKAWIEKCHPDSSFSRLVLKLTEPLHTKQDWIDALFVRLEGPRWSYKPKLFAELRDDCENSREAEGIASPVKIGKGFPFITYCDPDRETLRMKVVPPNGEEVDYPFKIGGEERWHYVLQFARATRNRIALKPFKRGKPINLSLVFRDTKGYNNRMFYSYTRTTGGSKAKYWLEQTQLKKRSKRQL